MKPIRVIFVSALITVATAAAPQQPTSQMSKAGALRTKVVGHSPCPILNVLVLRPP